MRANEAVLVDDASINARLDRIVAVMFDCIDRGIRNDGELPGGLKVRRRARALRARLQAAETRNVRNSIAAMDYASLYAIAVNEENASGGRVVTAPTNGAAGRHPGGAALLLGVLPGCLKRGHADFLLTGAGDWRALQDECVDLRRRSRLPG